MSAKLTEAETDELVDSVNLGALPGPEHDFWVTSTNLLIPEVEAILTARMAQAWDEGHKTWWRRGFDGCMCGAYYSGECGCGKYGTGELLSLQDNPYREVKA